MKIVTLALAGLALGAPATASATGSCDQINGTYVAGRIGKLSTVPALLAFDRLVLNAGAGAGRQVQVANATASTGDQYDLAVTCAPLDATHARLIIKARRSGSGTALSDAGSIDVTLFNGGERLWVVGNTPPGSMPGWLLRVPANP